MLSMLGGTAGLVIAGLLLRVLNQWRSPYGRLAVSVDARVYSGSSDLDLGKRVAVWDDSGAASVAEQSVAGDEERTGGFNAAAPVYVAGPVARRTNCDLHVARDGLAGRRPRHGSHVARSAGFSTAGSNAGQHRLELRWNSEVTCCLRNRKQ